MNNELLQMHRARISRGVQDNLRFQKARKLRDAAAVLDSLPATLMNSTTSQFLRQTAEDLAR